MNMGNWIGDFVVFACFAVVVAVVVFHFLDWKHLFWINLVEKLKTVS